MFLRGHGRNLGHTQVRLGISVTMFLIHGVGHYSLWALEAEVGLEIIGTFRILYRGMSSEEFQKWESGEIIPKGKFFTSQATNQYAQDISGQYPELFRFRVRDDAVIQTSPDTYQIMRDSKLEGKKIVPI